jgi:glucose/arabinose dehydrogenase
MMRRALFAAAVAVPLAAPPAQATTLPSGFTETRLATGLTAPTAMEIAPDGRVFVLEQPGRVRVVKNGVLLTAPFVSIAVDASLERGLLGIAFDPAFTTNHFVYLHYTATTPAPHNRVARFTANGDLAVAGSQVVLLELPNLSSAENHNGGAIHFGRDGKLYVAVGENANPARAPQLTSVMGKILRVNADGSIPTDNPFYTQTTGQNRAIWAKGLRNPFTFAFQPGTGRMFIDDVGNLTWEEINDGVAGRDYGWGSSMVDGDATAFYRYGSGQVVVAPPAPSPRGRSTTRPPPASRARTWGGTSSATTAGTGSARSTPPRRPPPRSRRGSAPSAVSWT